jgi:hypothetical protein
MKPVSCLEIDQLQPRAPDIPAGVNNQAEL